MWPIVGLHEMGGKPPPCSLSPKLDCVYIMTIEAAREAFCERETEHFGVSPFCILDALGAKLVEEYAKMIEQVNNGHEQTGLTKAQHEAVLLANEAHHVV